MSELTLYSYWRSTTAYRVRIALGLKGLAFKTVSVDLTKGEQSAPDYMKLNPGQGVPTLVLPDGTVLSQSMAILNWLDRTYPTPALAPADPLGRAKVEAAALTIACDIHPINNLKVINRLKSMGHSQDEAILWMQDWMRRGFEAYEGLIETNTAFSFGDTPTLADICLIPQLYNAHRWGLALGTFSRLTEIETRCLALPAFEAARPENQPDAAKL